MSEFSFCRFGQEPGERGYPPFLALWFGLIFCCCAWSAYWAISVALALAVLCYFQYCLQIYYLGTVWPQTEIAIRNKRLRQRTCMHLVIETKNRILLLQQIWFCCENENESFLFQAFSFVFPFCLFFATRSPGFGFAFWPGLSNRIWRWRKMLVVSRKNH